MGQRHSSFMMAPEDITNNSKLPPTEHGARKLWWGRGHCGQGWWLPRVTRATLTIPSLEGEILLSVTLYRGLHKAVRAGNWCPGLLIALCLLPNL